MNAHSDVEISKLSDEILFFPGHANIVAFKIENKVIVVEAGRNYPDSTFIRKNIEEHFKTSIDTVVITHFHSDHTHSIPLYADCKVVSSDLSLKYLKAAKRRVKTGLEKLFPNVTFSDEYVIDDNSYKVLIKKTGGHTPDSVYVYSKKNKILAVGDNLRSDFLWGGRGSDLEDWIKALEEYIDYDVEFIIPGHGVLLNLDTVSQTLIHLKDFKKELNRLLFENVSKEEVLSSLLLFEPKNDNAIPIHESTIKKWVNLYSKKKK